MCYFVADIKHICSNLYAIDGNGMSQQQILDIHGKVIPDAELKFYVWGQSTTIDMLTDSLRDALNALDGLPVCTEKIDTARLLASQSA